ncbi:radical SAM family heme chaperone HemW [Halalkalibacterium halodurans]|uniref:radical SAM family heme chaperone HemW n=1 Tax=Halalkalibacterium halodurans TaxID=86665 RepID=UPI002E1D8D68|nr:radical SAM family heme chaperone HemW [Halalkalibacterium halodurans]MED4122519.1 radical SAM family heme chaperone HemW [Halalkalibacterium halodurans]
MPKAAYIHIPFCEHICYYCDFNKFYLKNQPVNEYLQALETEMAMVVAEQPTKSLQTLYVGGGTPTALTADQLAQLLASIKRTLPLSDLEEFTFEVNPDSIDEEKLDVLRSYGVDRLSIGVQAFQPLLLKEIGRTHDQKSVEQAVEKSRQAGFANLSLDLMLGLPKQTPEMFAETLKEAFALEVEHLSCYSLKVEAKTVFYNRQRQGRLTLPPEDDEVKMYRQLCYETEKHGFTQYEISNFAKKGYESRHNLVYWNNDEYYGFGAGAHGYVGGVRYMNHGPLPKYLQAIEEGRRPVFESHHVSRVEQMEEQMFLGLRKRSGVEERVFVERFGVSMFSLYEKQIAQLVARCLLERTDDRVRLTDEGLLLGNEVFEQFLAVLDEGKQQ